MGKVSEKEALAICSVEGCGRQVSKPGHTLCYTHWKAENGHENNDKKPTDTSGQNKPGSSTPSVHLTSTQLGEKLGISSQRLNLVLAELGWIEKARKGWIPSEQGKKLLAEGREHHITGIPFVLWPDAILASRILTNSVNELMTGRQENTSAPVDPTEKTTGKPTGFREKFEPTHRIMDGHWVRSKAEALIDNWLYMSGIVHAYERLLPVEEELYCDFYIPEGKVYVEYWGMESDPKYQARKKTKLEIYRKYGFSLIELNDEHVRNLDDHLPKMLLKYNVTSN